METRSRIETGFAIHPATRPGHVHLTAGDLDRQIVFYQNVMGFKLHWREGASAGLGAGAEDLLRLTELRGARRVRGRSGLYHFAVLFPNRRELARVVGRLFSLRYPNAPTDHVITKRPICPTPRPTASSSTRIHRRKARGPSLMVILSSGMPMVSSGPGESPSTSRRC